MDLFIVFVYTIIAFVCETLVLWRTRWSNFLPAVATSFTMNLAAHFIVQWISISISIIVRLSGDDFTEKGVFYVPYWFAFTIFDSLTMLFIARWQKWPHTPSTTIRVAIWANNEFAYITHPATTKRKR